MRDIIFIYFTCTPKQQKLVFAICCATHNFLIYFEKITCKNQKIVCFQLLKIVFNKKKIEKIEENRL